MGISAVRNRTAPQPRTARLLHLFPAPSCAPNLLPRTSLSCPTSTPLPAMHHPTHSAPALPLACNAPFLLPPMSVPSLFALPIAHPSQNKSFSRMPLATAFSARSSPRRSSNHRLPSPFPSRQLQLGPASLVTQAERTTCKVKAEPLGQGQRGYSIKVNDAVTSLFGAGCF